MDSWTQSVARFLTLVFRLGGLTAFGLLLVAPDHPSRAGTFTVLPLSGDADSGISTAKSYTHAVDVVNTWVFSPWNEPTASLTINGVTFEVGSAAGANWSLYAPSIYTGDSGTEGVTGQVGQLLRYFRYGPTNNNATLTLTGLVAGETYTTTWYNKNWSGGVSGRVADITANDDGTTFTFDQNNSGNPSMLRYAFVAPASGSITYTFANGSNSFHQYGFSNELTSTPNQWDVAGGGSWNATGNWSDATAPNGVDAVAWVLNETGSAAAITLDSPVTVGALYLDNTAGYNIAGPSSLTMEVSSGRALVSGMDGSHTLSAPLVLASDTDVAARNGRTIAISGAISGSGQLFTTGLGQVLASGNSTSYSQQVNVQSGALRLGHANAVGSGDIVVAGGAIVQLWWNSGSSTLANNITLNGLGFTGGKDAIYADGGGGGFGAFTLSGTITLNATSNIGGNNANNVDITGQITGSGGLTKGGSRTDENNTLILSNPANDYAGDTTINKGTLRLGASDVIPDGAGAGRVIVNSGAVFDLGGFDETVNGLSGSGAVTNNRATSGVNTLTVHNDAAASVTPLLQDGTNGKLALAKTGSGTLEIARANTYSGGTIISDGTLKSVVSNAAGSGLVTIAAGATWDIGTESHSIAGLSGEGTVRSGIATGSDGAALIADTNSYVLKLDFGNGTGATVNNVTFDSVTTSGAGWTLSGATTVYGESGTPTGYDQLMSDFCYAGNPGTLTFTDLTPGQNYRAVLYTRVGSWGGRPQDATFTNGTDVQQLLATDPGTLGYYAYTFTADDTTASISMLPHSTSNTFHWFAASLEQSSTPTSVLTIGDSSSYSFSGVIGGLTSLVKQGSGTQTLLGDNTYTGGTTVSQGALLMGTAGALSTGDVSVASGANVLLWWNTGDSTVTNNFTLNGLGSVGGKDALYADGGSAGYGEYTLSGTITLAATSNIGGHNVNDLNLTGQVTGPGGLVKGGSRTDESNVLTLSNPLNDYSGGTTVSKGVLRLGASEVIPDGAGRGGVTVNAGATLDLGSHSETINNLAGDGNVTFAEPLTGPTYFTTDAGTDISTAKTYTHLLDFNAGSSVATVNDVAFTAAGTSGANWSLNATSAASNTNTGMADSGGMDMLLEDFQYNGNPAELALTGLTAGVTYEVRFYNRAWGVGGNRTQTITFDEDGAGPASTVEVFNEDASGTPNYIGYVFTAVSDGVGGTFPLTVTFVPEVAGNTYHFYGLSNEVATLPSLTVGDESSTTFSGTIGGAGRLVKQGTGTLTLSGANTYIGPTDVNAGTLLVNGAHTGGGIYTVASGATLGGTGTLNSVVALSGDISPGNSVGTLATGDQTWLDGGSFTFELQDATDAGGAGSGWDLLAVTGQLDLQQLSPEGFTIHLTPLPAGGPQNFSCVYPASFEWEFVQTTGGILGFDASLFELDAAAFESLIDDGYGPGTFGIELRNDAHDLVLTFVAAVPEPSTFALLALALLSLVFAGRRRKR